MSEMTLRERKVTGKSQCNGESSDDKETEFSKPLYVLVFSLTAAQETVRWLIDLLQRSQYEGGAELLVRTTPATENKGIIVEVSAMAVRLLEAAEMMEIKKEDKDGNIREFIFSSIDLFLKPGTDMDNLLSTSEKQRIILEEIMNLQSRDKKEMIGYPSIKLYPGQSIVQVCRNNGIIEQIFPLHEPKKLEELEKKWFLFPLGQQPLDEIRKYFGEAVGFYFAFMGFYTWALVPPALIGILQTIISLGISQSHVFFAIFKMIWVTLFLESWKRRSNELAFTWGTLTTAVVPKMHPTFRGKYMGIDPVTKQHAPVYPGYKRHLKVYCVSTPIIFLCLIFAVIVMVIYFEIESFVMDIFRDEYDLFGWILMQLPGVVYAILVVVMNRLYANLATSLTEWENHKTQMSFDNHRIVKLLLFEFVNNFLAMGYIAFYLQDMEMLKWQVGIMLVVYQLINHFQEALLPLLLQKHKRYQRRNGQQLSNSSESKRLQQVIDENEMWPYEGTYDDYLEVFIQFGYVFLFSSVFPLAAFLALINNVLEIWADAFKLCRAYQRPQAKPVKGIGVWQIAFEALGVIAVMSNCALISMSPLVRSAAPDLSLASWILVAVAIEHIIIGVKITLAYLITDMPKWVRVSMERAQYESLQALKMERKTRTKEMLKWMKKKQASEGDNLYKKVE